MGVDTVITLIVAVILLIGTFIAGKREHEP